MARWQGTTAERGYGTEHRRLRRLLLARWRPGDPCARCGRPMWGPESRIHLGHTTDRRGYTGLEHESCNTSEGARRGNRARRFIPEAVRSGSHVTCTICGAPYTRAARTCAICGCHYHPSRQIQHTCGRACGAKYKRRKLRSAS